MTAFILTRKLIAYFAFVSLCMLSPHILAIHYIDEECVYSLGQARSTDDASSKPTENTSSKPKKNQTIATRTPAVFVKGVLADGKEEDPPPNLLQVEEQACKEMTESIINTLKDTYPNLCYINPYWNSDLCRELTTVEAIKAHNPSFDAMEAKAVPTGNSVGPKPIDELFALLSYANHPSIGFDLTLEEDNIESFRILLTRQITTENEEVSTSHQIAKTILDIRYIDEMLDKSDRSLIRINKDYFNIFTCRGEITEQLSTILLKIYYTTQPQNDGQAIYLVTVSVYPKKTARAIEKASLQAFVNP